MEDVYLLSEHPPHSQGIPQEWDGLLAANEECRKHCELLETRFGEFQYAAPDTKFKVKIFFNFPFFH